MSSEPTRHHGQRHPTKSPVERFILPWLFVGLSQCVVAMESPFPFIETDATRGAESIAPTCHSLESLTSTVLPIHALQRLAGPRGTSDVIEKGTIVTSHDLVRVTDASDGPVYDIHLDLSDDLNNRAKLVVVGVGRVFCPIYLHVYHTIQWSRSDSFAVRVGETNILATEMQEKASGAFVAAAYFVLSEDGVALLDVDQAIGQGLSGLEWPGHCRIRQGYGFDIRRLTFRRPIWCRWDANCCPSGGAVEVDFRLQDGNLVPTRSAYLPPEAVAVESPYPFTYKDDSVGQIETIVPTCHSLDYLSQELPIGALKWSIDDGATISAHRLVHVTTTSLGSVYDLFLELRGASYYDEVKLIIVPFGDDYCPVYLNMLNRLQYPGPNDSFAVEGTAATIIASEMQLSGTGGFVEVVHLRIEGSDVKRLDLGIRLGRPVELPAVLTSDEPLDWYFSDRQETIFTTRQDPPSSTSP